MDRRSFFTATAATFLSDSVLRARVAAQSVTGRPTDTVARDEDFWLNIRPAFTVDRNVINLSNGDVAPSPKIVSDTEKRYLGCDPEEIAITRNTSESLEAVAVSTPGEYQGLRITPNVYTPLEEIDTFTEVMEKIIKRGSIPA